MRSTLCLEENDVFVALLPPNTTDLLQPLNITVNKPAKNYLWQQFQEIGICNEVYT